MLTNFALYGVNETTKFKTKTRPRQDQSQDLGNVVKTKLFVVAENNRHCPFRVS